MKRREMKLLLEERFERVALLETRIDTMDQLVEGYRAREQAILDTLSSAQQTATRMLEQAKSEAEQARAGAATEAERTRSAANSEAEQTLTSAAREANQTRAAAANEAELTLAAALKAAEEARATADSHAAQTRAAASREAYTLLTDTKATAEALRTEAEHHVREMLGTAKSESERILRDAELIKNEYEEIIESFNTLIEQNASELQVTAVRFAEFMERCKIRLPENILHQMPQEQPAKAKPSEPVDLPDPSDNPSQLMQNIYRIQNRPIPEEQLGVRLERAMEEAESAVAALQPEAAAELPAQPAAEPYSEAAWQQDRFESESEPQAEFVQSFDGDFEESEFVVRPDGCHLTQADTAQEVDALLAAPELAQGAQIAPEAAAYAALAFGNAGGETKAAAERAFDEFFGEGIEPGAEPPKSEAMNAAAQPLEPEPYSAEAWTHASFESESEPQAEFVQTFDGNYAQSEFVVRADGCHLTQAETEPAAEEPSAQTELPDAQAQEELADHSAGADRTEAERAFDELFGSFDQPDAAAEPAQATELDERIPAEEASETQEPAQELQAEQVEEPAQSETQAALNEFYAIAGEPAPAPEPYSEAAFASDAFTSDHEPQAEGALFSADEPMTAEASEPAEQEPEYAQEPQAEEPAQSETQAALNEFYAIAGEPVPAPEPYSEAAFASDAFTSDHEPQAEGALFSADEPMTTEEPEPAEQEPEPAQELQTEQADEPAQELQAEESEQSETQAALNEFYAIAGEPVPAPEPYSEAAFASDAFMSDHEPQAEGALFSADEPEVEPEPERMPLRYNEFGEVREWEPEPEPEMEEILTVSSYVGQSGPEEEVSLDDLLNEIIRAGE